MDNLLDYFKFNEGKAEKFPNIKKMDMDGYVVYLGRDARSNDHLTFNIANPEDYWFHVKGIPGSHVVIRVKDKLPTKEVIKAAAELAKKNSKIDKSKNTCTVVYCQRKFVKKESNMKDGEVRVDYINAHEINI